MLLVFFFGITVWRLTLELIRQFFFARRAPGPRERKNKESDGASGDKFPNSFLFFLLPAASFGGKQDARTLGSSSGKYAK